MPGRDVYLDGLLGDGIEAEAKVLRRERRSTLRNSWSRRYAISVSPFIGTVSGGGDLGISCYAGRLCSLAGGPQSLPGS